MGSVVPLIELAMWYLLGFFSDGFAFFAFCLCWLPRHIAQYMRQQFQYNILCSSNLHNVAQSVTLL